MPGTRKTGNKVPDCQKITVLLPDEMAVRLRRRATQMGIKVGPLIRFWVEIQLNASEVAEKVTVVLPPC